MTWQSAQATAEGYLRRLQLPKSLKGVTIQLADYESDEDLKFLKGQKEWSLEFHRMVNKAMARLLKKRGANIRFVTVSMVAYFSWLARYDLKNTAANRAQFIGWSTAPDPKPMPSKDGNETF